MKKGFIYGVMREGVVLLIHLYRHTFSIVLGPCCRFTPSCSSYALIAIQRFGVIKGGFLSFRRVLKCHPFHVGGYDPVPEVTQETLEEGF